MAEKENPQGDSGKPLFDGRSAQTAEPGKNVTILLGKRTGSEAVPQTGPQPTVGPVNPDVTTFGDQATPDQEAGAAYRETPQEGQGKYDNMPYSNLPPLQPLPVDDSLDGRYLERRQRIYDAVADTGDPQPTVGPLSTANRQPSTVLDDIAAIPMQAVGGVRDAAVEMGKTVELLGDWLRHHSEAINTIDRMLGGKHRIDIPEVPREGGLIGGLTRGTAQFLTGFIPIAKVAGGISTARGAMAANAAAMGAAFDPKEPGLANLISGLAKDHPGLKDVIDKYFAANPNDTEITGRLKKALEGAGFAAGIEGVMLAFKAMKQAGAFKALQNESGMVRLFGRDEPLKKSKTREARVNYKKTLSEGGGGGDKVPPEVKKAAAEDASNRFKGFDVDIDGRLGINWGRIDTTDDVKNLIAAARQDFAENILKANPKASFEEIEKTALDKLRADPKGEIARSLNLDPNETFRNLTLDQIIVRTLRVHAANEAFRLLQLAKAGDAAAKTEWFRQMGIVADLNRIDQQFSHGASVLLGSRKIVVGEIDLGKQAYAEKTSEMLAEAQASGGITPEQLFQRFAALETPQQLAKVAEKALRPGGWEYFLEYWYAALLSGPATHFANIIGNVAVAAAQIPERFVAGVGRSMFGGKNEGVAIGETLAQLYGLREGIKDGFKAAAKAMKTGESSGLFTAPESYTKALTAKNVGADPGGFAGRAVDFIGNTMRLPGRFLMTEDEFFKAVGYRMELQAQAYRKATGEGLQGEALEARIKEIVDNPPENLRVASIDAAHYQTFSRDLDGFAKTVQDATNKHKLLKLGLPFIRTPTNIMKYAFERTPLAPFSASVRADIAAGGARRDLALARIATGSMLLYYGYTLALEGRITGGGPKNKAERETLLRTGWQPYSLVSTNEETGEKKYYSFNRLDPYGMFYGLAADLAEALISIDYEDGAVTEKNVDEMVAGAVLSVSRNVTSKSWMQGLAQSVDALSGDMGKTENAIEKLAASMVPAAAGTVAKVIDPEVKYVDGTIDAMKAKIPVFSKDVPAKLNLWGEKVTPYSTWNVFSPVRKSEHKPDPVNDEIARLQMGIPMPSRSIGGIELTPQQYNRLVEIAGKPAKEEVGKLILTDSYRKATDGPEGGKAEMIKMIINSHKKQARLQLQKEIPELGAEITNARADKIEKLTGKRPIITQR